MMKIKGSVATAVLVLTALILPASSFGAVNVKFNAVGSSAAFNALALAAYTSSQCGTNIWTKKSTAQAIDGRSPSIPAETGNIWIIWATNAQGNVTTICSYLRVDSVVGVRMFMATPRATLSVPSANIGLAGDNLVPTLTDTPLTTNAFNAINAQIFNCAPTDIRAEDALFATTRALGSYNPPSYTGLGYGPGPIGSPILSAFSTSSFNVINFALTGPDPITGQQVPAWNSTNVGGQVELVFVNTNDTNSGGLGSSIFQNVDRFVLANVFNGTLTRTRDLVAATGLPSVGLHAMLREPLSGTYNTFEFQIPRNKEIASTQEVNVNPAAGGNPLNITYASGGSRQRVIGTGEMTKEVSAITDSIGYAFWSTGNFSSVVGNTKYLTVDGVDPLFANYEGGFIPTCTAPCPGIVQFTHVLDGSYPIWNILRIVTASPTPGAITSLVNAAQTQVLNVPDFVPIGSMQVFRSHYSQSGFGAHNGHKTGTKESGGDVQGAVFTVEADFDSIADTGLELINNYKQ
jgi:hypothetical protein